MVLDPKASSSSSQIPTSPSPASILPTTVVVLNHTISMKLDRENFHLWQSQIIPILHGYGLYHFLHDAPPPPTIISGDGVSQTNVAYSAWYRQDQILLGWLRSSLTGPILGQVVSAKTTSEMWSNLQRSFTATSKARLFELRLRLQNISKGNSTCSDFIQKVQSIADELAFIGSPVSDDDLILHVLNGLGPEFDSFVMAATTSPRSLPDIKAQLLSHENLLNSRLNPSSSLPSGNPAAYYSNQARRIRFCKDIHLSILRYLEDREKEETRDTSKIQGLHLHHANQIFVSSREAKKYQELPLLYKCVSSHRKVNSKLNNGVARQIVTMAAAGSSVELIKHYFFSFSIRSMDFKDFCSFWEF